MREDFPHGRFQLRIENSTLKLDEQRRFLAANAESIVAFKTRQQAAFEAERERWKASGSATAVESEATSAIVATPEAAQVPEGCVAMDAPVTGSVWLVNVTAGARV